MKRAVALGAALALPLVPLLVRLLVAQSPPPSQAAPPPTYTLTDLGPLSVTAAPSGATALNAAGQVTGFRFENFPNTPVCLAQGANEAFLWNPSSPPPPTSGTYTELGTLGGASGFGYGINNAGQIVGAADICINNGFSDQRAFIWQNGTITALDPSTNSSDGSAAFAINTNGDVAGYINHANTGVGYQAVIWKGGTAAGLTVLTPLPCQFSPYCQSKALAINDSGQAAGWGIGPFVSGPIGSYNANQAVMWDTNGQPTGLGSLGNYFDDQANAIDSKGDVVGYSGIDPYTIHAVLWQNGTATDLGAIPGIDPLFGPSANITDNNSSAWGINSKGDIVGISAYGTQAVTQGNGGRAFLYTGGQMYDLLSLLAPGTNWRQLKAAWAINDAGQIVGVGIDANQQEHGFLLTPIITPTTTAVTASVNPSVFGQQVSFSVTVTPTQSSSLTPTGNVTFSDGKTVLGTVALTFGTAIFSTAGLAVGRHSITVSYAGDNNFGSSTSAVLTQFVNQAATNTTLAVSPNPSNLGQTVTLMATVTVFAPDSSTPTGPTGTVTFSDGTTTLGRALLNGAATATFSTSSLASGSHSITATYGGDANFSGSAASSNVTVTVQGPPPPVQITDNETIHVTDAESSPDVFDAEAVHVADAVFVTPLIQVSAPVAEFSVGSLGFSGQSGSQTITVSDISLASLTLTSATVNGSSQFTVTQVACSNSATSLSTVLPSGGVCAVTIGYTASAMPTNDNGLLTFTDNAALSNLPTVASGSNYTQSIPLSGLGSSTPPPPPPPAVVPVTDNETILVADTVSFPDVFDAEAVHVADAVFITPLIQVSAPVAEFSAGSLGFSGQSGSQTITVSDISLASLTLASVTVSGSSQFTVTQVACSNSATSLSTVLPSGGVCAVTIGYTASATPANDNGLLTFADNAALSNLPTVASGSNYTQSIPLSGSGSSTPPPPPPPAVIPVMDNETIHVADTVSFPDVYDTEAVHVADAVFVTPLIQVSAPAAEFSAGSLGFGGQSGSQTITVSDIGLATLTLTSATVSGSSQFTVTQISCTNSSASLSTVLPSGGVCAVKIGYTASATPANDNGLLTFTDNAALSNLPTVASGSNYAQSIPLNGSGTSTAPPPPPPAVVPVMDNETISVTDTVSFPDVFDAEVVHVADAVFVTPLINVAAPVVDYSAGSLGFGNVSPGQTGTQSIALSDIGQASLTVSSGVLSQGSAFSVTQIACSNGATSLPTTLQVGGVCTFLIAYAAPSGAAVNDVLTFTDNAALSNVASVQAGSNYTQSIPLNGAGTSTAPPPPPPAVVPVLDNETIHVTDTPSFPDVFDSEPIKVTDQVAIQVLNTTTTSISIGGGSVYGTPVSVVVSVGSATAPVTGNVTLSVDGGTAATMMLTSGSATFNPGVLKAGNHALAASFPAQGNFTGSSAQATLGVTQATPTITWANPAAITIGTALSAVQLNATAPASVPGTFAYTPPLGTVLSAGSHTLSVTFSPTDSTDYTTATASVTILVLNTIVGTNIGVTPLDTITGLTPVTMNFSNVTKAGTTGLTTSSTGAPPPPAFQPGVPPVYYDISTTATFTGTVTICIHYSGITFIQPPHLFHLENGVWVDRTTSIDPVNMIVCGTVTSFSPFALFAPLPALTITAPNVPRQYGQTNPPLNNVTYSGFVNGDTPSVLSGTLSCVSPAAPTSPIGTYAITCSGLTSSNYTIKYAPGVLTVTPAPLTVTAANAQRVYGAANPALTGTITGIQNGDNITATYTTATTSASPVGTYAIAPTLVDPTGKLGNYKVTFINGTLTVVQASTTTSLNASPDPSNFGQSVTLAATVAPVAPGAGTATGKVTFFDGSTTLGTSTLSSTDTATLTTSSLAAGSHSLSASYGGDPNFSGSSSSAVSDQVQCGVLISLSPSSVPVGGTVTVSGKVISCSTTTQMVVVKFSLSGPSQPNSCSSTKSEMFTTPPFPLPPKTAQTVSFPFKVPSKGVCPGTYSITATTLVNGVAVDTSTASLTITAH